MALIWPRTTLLVWEVGLFCECLTDLVGHERGWAPLLGSPSGLLETYVGVQWEVAINGLLVLVYVPYLWLGTPRRRID